MKVLKTAVDVNPEDVSMMLGRNRRVAIDCDSNSRQGRHPGVRSSLKVCVLPNTGYQSFQTRESLDWVVPFAE